MRGHDRRSCGGAHREVVGIGEPTDVVAHDGSGGERGPRHGGPPRIDAQRHVETGAERFDGGNHPVEFFLLVDLRTGAGLHATHVEEIGAIGHETLSFAQELVESEVRALVVERVRRSVQDANDDGLGRDVESTVAEVQVHRGRTYTGGAN